MSDPFRFLSPQTDPFCLPVQLLGSGQVPFKRLSVYETLANPITNTTTHDTRIISIGYAMPQLKTATRRQFLFAQAP